MNYDDVKINSDLSVSYYEWSDGQGRDCGLNREAGPFETRQEAQEYADALIDGEDVR